jgi:Ca-activated chloride channel family protein
MHEDIQVARVDLAIVHAGSTQAHTYGKPEAIRVHWTDDAKLSSLLDSKVAHYTGHTDLRNAVKAGWDAHETGDVDQARVAWGHAVVLAAKLGHNTMLMRLGRIVDIDGDPANGVVRIKRNLQPRQIISAVLGSYTSAHSPDSAVQQANPERPAGPDRTCPKCGYVSPATAKFCMPCGSSLGETA